MTSSSTVTGSSMYSGTPLWNATCTGMPSSRNRAASPTRASGSGCCS
ncbi:Uncharacterised protein [Mycobacterium tuberculosis]|nr:Uncharacterised protein [Mycobacterium tuberculosis]